MPERPIESPWARTTEPLLWLEGAGHETYGDAAYYYDARTRADRPHATLQLTLAGEGFHDGGKGRVLLPPGRAFLAMIPGPFEYGYSATSRRPYELVFVSLGGEVAIDWLTRLTGQFGHVLELGYGGAAQAQMLALAHAREAGSLPDRYQLSGQLYTLLMTVYSSLTTTRAQTTPRVSRAIELIVDRAADPRFNVESLAEALDCSREYIARLFREATGVAPSDYLTQQRVRLVAHELRRTTDKLDAIARRCGFSGANYLCRTFRKRTGVTPDRFRQDAWRTIP